MKMFNKSYAIGKLSKNQYGLISSMLRWLSSNSTNLATSLNVAERRKTPILLVEDNHQKGVRYLRLNCPKNRNALSKEMIDALNYSIVDLLNDASEQHLKAEDSFKWLRALIISSNVEDFFSSGHDLKELATNSDREFRREIFMDLGKFLMNLQQLSVPVICQIDGLATAAGCQLAVSGDLILATKKTRFSTPGSNFGLFCFNPSIALYRRTNFNLTAFLTLTGQSITAQEAFQNGMINSVSETTEELHDCTETILDSIRMKSKSVVAIGKQFLYKQAAITNLSLAYRI
ncbi:hypothetical protein SSS_06712 [Sarcoptes scabiei]|nr:hypothetical protein SSS_06712 [Sarcoptes scabiei]